MNYYSSYPFLFTSLDFTEGNKMELKLSCVECCFSLTRCYSSASLGLVLMMCGWIMLVIILILSHFIDSHLCIVWMLLVACLLRRLCNACCCLALIYSAVVEWNAQYQLWQW